MSTASVPTPETITVLRNPLEARFPTVQSVLERRSTHHQRVLWEGSDASAATQDDARMCSHWPERGHQRIQAAARLLHVLADRSPWDEAFPIPTARQSGCIDLEILVSEPIGEALMLRLAAHSAQVQTQKIALRELAGDFATIGAWLANAAASSWDATKIMRNQLGLSVAFGESQRLISKDALSADINALIAAMLRRAVQLLDRLDLATGAVKADQTGRRTVARGLLQAAELLDNAATLAGDGAGFVQEFDRRWRQIRHKVAQAVALTGSPATSMEAGM